MRHHPKERSTMNYVVLQVILKEKLIGSGSGNLTALEKVLNDQAAKGYRLHTISTASSGLSAIVREKTIWRIDGYGLVFPSFSPPS